MKVQGKKLLALALVLTLALSCLSACGGKEQASQAQASASTAGMDAVAEAASALLPSHGSAEGKEETVYVIANPKGDPQRTIVSAWLKNPEEADTITDRSDLKNIQNVKGDETYTASGGDLIWNAQGKDIYYQGDSKKALPLAVHVSYKLDGKEIKPEKLAGASGHLEMTFRYENKTGRREKIDGKDVTVYQPFVAVSCLVLDSSKASAVEVTNGTMINSGEQVIVAGLAMPGLKESLGLDNLEDADGEKLDAEIPETVTISAEVKDFSLLTTVTLVENALLNDLNLDDVEGFDDLKSSVDKLVDASTQLVTGAGDLYDGTKTLSSGTGELAKGTAKLSAGAKELEAGAETAQKGLADAAQSMQQISGGLSQLNEKVGLISPDSIKVDLAKLQAAERGLNTANTTAAGISKELEEVDFSEAATLLGQLQTAMAGSQDQVKQVQAAGSGIEHYENAVKDALSSLATAANCVTDEAQKQEVQKQIQAVIDDANTALGESGKLTSQLQAVSAPALPEGVEGKLQTLSDSVTKLQDAADGVARCAAGVTTVISGNDGQNLETMLSQLSSLPGEVQQLPGAVSELSAGASKLYDGLEAGAQNANSLVAGAKELTTGASDLDSGAKELDGGVKQVMDGASALLDGMTQFDGDGVKVLSRLFEEDAQGFMDRLRAVQAYGREYDSFSGLADGMSGRVRFVIRTDSIGD